MATTEITWIQNNSRFWVSVLNTENPAAKGHGLQIPPKEGREVGLVVPWAGNPEEFGRKHLQLQMNGATRFWIWQAWKIDGDFVRFCSNGRWREPGTPVYGFPPVEGHRTMVVWDQGFELEEIDPRVEEGLRRLAGNLTQYRLCNPQPPGRPQIPSVPRRSSSAFSVAGPPSDAFDRGVRPSRFGYRDSGKRYRFQIGPDAVVSAISPDGSSYRLTEVFSHQRLRQGESLPAPPLDMVVASGARVFAKAAGRNDFFIAMMDHLFIHAGEDGVEFPVPSVFFKFDPEFNHPSAHHEHLTNHIAGSFGGHPAAERFPLYRVAVGASLIDAMVARFDRRKWYPLDVRPGLGATNLIVVFLEQLKGALTGLGPFLPQSPQLSDLRAEVDRQLAEAVAARDNPVNSAPLNNLPPTLGIPLYDHVTYCGGSQPITLRSIDYRKVLDLGISALHLHDQYEGITGGEMQPMRTSVFTPLWDFLYRIPNGPIGDADGFNDGTCNYYALVQLKDEAALAADRRNGFGILYIDEQSYFSQRWRLLHPDDYRGLVFSVVVLNGILGQQYKWNPATYWCPFRAGRIGPRSRMAVARQVVLTTEDTGSPDAVPSLFSITFSWSAMDRTWRWRRLPGDRAAYFSDTVDARTQPVPPGTANNTVFPQTIGLREDMTIHVKGTATTARGLEAGRWYQRYLASPNQLVPPPDQLVAGQQPGVGYTHPWKFLPEPVFQAADWFSHLGVYDEVDSRSQYYVVEPVTESDRSALQQVHSQGLNRPWLDTGLELYVRQLRLWWAGPARVLADAVTQNVVKRPPSMFNPETRLRIVPRGNQWIAMHWDKRDDDLRPFENMGPFGSAPEVTLTNEGLRAKVRILSNGWLEQTPTAALVEIRVPATAGQPVRMTIVNPTNVWRVRMAALQIIGDPAAQKPGVVPLLDVEFAKTFFGTGTATGSFSYQWSVGATTLDTFFSEAGVVRQATTVWVEDIVGHVSPPTQIRWTYAREMRASSSPSLIPLNTPVQVTVRAQDTKTAQAVAGTVKIDGQVAGSTGTAFTGTFSLRPVRVFDPETRTYRTEYVDPVGSVSADGYPDCPIPFSFYTPQLRVWIDAPYFPIGRPVQVNVRAEEVTTRAAVAGRVKLGGQDFGATNTPFTYTFGASPPSGVVEAPNFPPTYIAWPPLRQPGVWASIEPRPVPIEVTTNFRVTAIDSDSRAPVDGTVVVNGQDVARTNVWFSFAFIRTQHREYDPESRRWMIWYEMPSASVRVAGYPEVWLDLGV